MTITKPTKTNTFAPTNTIKSSEVNANFDDILDDYDTNGFIYKGWYPLVGASLEYHAADAVKTTTDVDLTGIIQAGDRFTFEQSTVTKYYIVREVYYNYITSNKTLIILQPTFTDSWLPVANAAITANTVGFSRQVRPIGFPGAVFNGNASNGLIEGKIARSVSSNDLITKITTPSGEDPSPQNPVGVYIDGGIRYITGETSYTSTAGTNHLNLGSAELATKEADLFVYIRLVKASDTLEHIVSRIPYANRLGDFVNSKTSERGILSIGDHGSTYAAGDPVVLVGRFAATLSATASFNWTVPTADENTLVQRPIYETRFLDWTPAYKGELGTMTISLAADSRNRRKYTIKNDMLWIEHSAILTTGGTANNLVIMTLPFTFGTSSNQGGRTSGSAGNIQNGGGIISGMDTGPSNDISARRNDLANMTLGSFWIQFSAWGNLR
jgi:hypothetical protein